MEGIYASTKEQVVTTRHNRQEKKLFALDFTANVLDKIEQGG